MCDDVDDDQEEQTDPDGQRACVVQIPPLGYPQRTPHYSFTRGYFRTWCRKKVCHAAMNGCNLLTFSHPTEVFF